MPTAILNFPVQYVRQQALPIDIDTVFATTADRTTYLTSPRRYPGMFVYDLQADAAFVLNAAGTSWTLFTAGGFTTAGPGLTASGSTVKLGQAVGAGGNPAKLTASVEIPLNNQQLLLSDIASNLGSLKVTGIILYNQIQGADGTLGSISNYSSPITVASGVYGTGYMEYPFITTASGFLGYSGVQSWGYVTGQNGATHGKFAFGYIAAFSAGQVWDGSGGAGNQHLGQVIGYFSSLNSQSGTVTNAYDVYASELNSTGATTNAPNVTNHYALYAETFTAATNNWGIYISGTQPNYFAGEVHIGTINTDSYTGTLLNVNGNSQMKTIYISGDHATLWSEHAGIDSNFRIVNLGSGEFGDLIEEVSSVHVTAGFQGYIGMYSTPYVFGATPQNPGSQAYVGGFSSIPVYDNAGATALPLMYGYYSAMNIQSGSVTSGYDYFCKELNTVSRVPNLTPTITNHYNFYADSCTKATNNWGVYINGPQISYFAGNVGLGTQTAPTVNLDIIAPNLTGSSATGALKIAQNWNTTGAPILISANVTNAASGAGAFLISLAVSASSKFSVDVSGNTIHAGSITTGDPGAGTAAWKLGTLVTAVVTPDTTRYLQVNVAGTIYKVIVSS